MDFRGPTPPVFVLDRTSATAGSGGVVAAGRQNQREGIDRKGGALGRGVTWSALPSFTTTLSPCREAGTKGKGPDTFC